MTSLIQPGRAHSQAQAWNPLLRRIQRNIAKAVRSIHDNQPGYPTASDSRGGKGGHSDPTGELACADGDPMRQAGEEVTTLVSRITVDLARLDKLTANHSGPSQAWRDALATEAAAGLNDEWNWCQTHERAGEMVKARSKNGRLCHTCEKDKAMLGGDPDEPWIEIGKRRRHNTKDARDYELRQKTKRKGKR